MASPLSSRLTRGRRIYAIISILLLLTNLNFAQEADSSSVTSNADTLVDIIPSPDSTTNEKEIIPGASQPLDNSASSPQEEDQTVISPEQEASSSSGEQPAIDNNQVKEVVEDPSQQQQGVEENKAEKINGEEEGAINPQPVRSVCIYK